MNEGAIVLDILAVEQHRIENGWSKGELAEKMGLTRARLWEIYKAAKEGQTVHQQNAVDLASLFGVEVRELLKRREA